VNLPHERTFADETVLNRLIISGEQSVLFFVGQENEKGISNGDAVSMFKQLLLAWEFVNIGSVFAVEIPDLVLLSYLFNQAMP